MRISDWSSDVCSSDLQRGGDRHRERAQRRADEGQRRNGRARGKRKGDELRAIADPEREQGEQPRRKRAQPRIGQGIGRLRLEQRRAARRHQRERSEEHTSELQSLMRISYAVFCLKKKKTQTASTII